MSVPISHDGACGDLTVQSTVSALHIPGAHTFIPFQQFSLADGSGLRNPADDNNNKSSLPVVSVVAAVTGLCPAIPVVSMQQQGQLCQSVVAPTIIPAVVTPMAVQSANGLASSTAMTMTSGLNINSHLSIATQQQPGIVNTAINLSNSQNSGSKAANSATVSASNSSINYSIATGAKSGNSTPSGASSKSTNSSSSGKSSSSGSQNISPEQTDDLVKPVFKDGELVLEVECGQNKAILYLSKLCQGSKGPCISFQQSWLTPNEFQFVSGRETAKDWKRSIRHHGKSLKLLLAKGILNVHPTMCDCDGCRQGATLTRKGEKRRIPNGERKPRKPNSGSANATGAERHVAGAFRPVASAAMAANLSPAGGAQAKPEAKRHTADKLKMADGSLQSNDSNGRANLPTKSSPHQRPVTLNTTATDHMSKQQGKSRPLAAGMSSPSSSAPSSASSSPCLSSENVMSTSSTLSAGSSNQGQVPQQKTPSTPSKMTNFASAISMATSLSTQTTPLPFIAPTQQHSPCLPVSAATAVPSAAPYSQMSSNPQTPQLLSPNLPGSDHAQTPSGSFGGGAPDQTGAADGQPENGEEEHGNSGSEEQEFDEDEEDDEDEDISDANIDDESDIEDEQVEDPNKTIENPITASEEMTPNREDSVDACESEKNDDADAINKTVIKIETDEAAVPDLSVPKEGTTKVTEARVESPAIPSAPEITQSPAAAPITSYGYSTSGAHPLSLSISTTNVKSEHIWVPPTLSPHSSESHIHRVLAIGQGLKSPPRVHPAEGFAGLEQAHAAFGHKDSSDKALSLKKVATTPIYDQHPHRPFDKKESPQAPVKIENPKGFHSIDRHLNHTHDNSFKREAVDAAVGKPTFSLDDKNRDREREERHRQRMKEERARKEREERRERERKEEKEAERRRMEEKEKRDSAKSHMESSVKQERSSNTPVGSSSSSSDASRRPPGGIADAAAFSEYMRMLAAGHGHAFNMSASQAYMPSLFAMRPQEAVLPAHLLHQLTAYGPQLTGLSKDQLVYQAAAGALPAYSHPAFAQLHPLLQRQTYSQASLAEYQRSLAMASVAAYPWSAAYPYLIPELAASTSAVASAGSKRHSTEMEAALEHNAKRLRMEGRAPDYTATWEYFAAAAAASQQQQAQQQAQQQQAQQQAQQQQQQRIAMAQAIPCGLESANMDKTAEYLRKRYLEYGSQAAAYLSALPEYARPMYHCACADHRDEDIRMWSVEDVCKFLKSLDGCGVYADHFREQRVDGRILALLTADHLVKTLGMKLGPAVHLSEAIAKKLQDISKMSNCDACRSIAMSQALHPMALPL